MATGQTLSRYLTPLTLYEPPEDEHELEEEEGSTTHKQVVAALYELASELDALVGNPSDVERRLTIDSNVLLPAITKHLRLKATSDHAVRALASLLSLGSMDHRQNKYARALYKYSGDSTLDEILALLERHGSDKRTLYIQEQAAKAIFYLSDAALLKGLANEQSLMNQIDIPRALRAMLDHASCDHNPNLQRWAASCICHLVVEEERRTTTSANDIASLMSIGRDVTGSHVYQSYLPELVSTGGIMILCSLMATDDSYTRVHATGALGATLEAARAIDESLSTLQNITRGMVRRPKTAGTNTVSQIIRAIVSSGGCDKALSQLLQSAENGVARVGCDFCASLVMPLLEDARGTTTLEEGYDCKNATDELGPCREAALALANGPCLPALLSLMRDPDQGGRIVRPLELKKIAMETLAAVSMAVGEMTKANPMLTEQAVCHMLEENIVPVMLAVLESDTFQSLSTKDTPSSRIREAAGIVISSMAVSSVDAMFQLQSCHAITSMLSALSDPSLASLPSQMRGDGALKCLGMLQTAAALLTHSQTDENTTEEDQINRLLEAIDAGAITTLSRILFTKMDWDSEDKAVGAMKARDACCRMLTAMFDIARQSGDNLCQNRLWEVVDADAHRRNPPHNIVIAALGVLQGSVIQGRHSLQSDARGPHFHAAVMDLVESSLNSVGSMCGSTVVPGQYGETEEFLDTSSDAGSQQEAAFRQQLKDASAVACDILTASKKNSGAVLPTMLVGGFSEKTAIASLRLALAIAQNGDKQQHVKLAASGILAPISSALQNAMNAGDKFRFSACLRLIKDCGPHVGAAQLSSVQAAIRTATSVLKVPIDPTDQKFVNTEALKKSCVQTLESLSSNASLWSAISKDAIPSIVHYLQNHSEYSKANVPHALSGIRGALRALNKIVAVPSHAVVAARAGLAEALAGILIKYADSIAVTEKDTDNLENILHLHSDDSDDESDDDDEEEVPILALDILHSLHQNKDARDKFKIMQNGAVLEGLASILGKSATAKPDPDGDSRADVCILCLDMFHSIFSSTPTLQSQLSSPIVSELVQIVAREPRLINALCATLLVHNNPTMRIPRFNSSQGNNGLQAPKQNFTIQSGYGPPLLLVMEPCGKYANTHMAAMQFLYRIAVLSNAMDSPASDVIWETMMHPKDLDEDAFKDEFSNQTSALAATYCSQFLLILHMETLVPAKNSPAFYDFNAVTNPILQHALLEALRDNLNMDDEYCQSLLAAMHIPAICLTIWNNPILQNLAFDMISLIVENATTPQDSLVRIFVESKSTLASLFQLLATAPPPPPPPENEQQDLNDIRMVVAHTLGLLAESGLLTEAVERFKLKNVAISGLASACLATQKSSTQNGQGGLPTSTTLSYRCMECLVDLLKGGVEMEATHIQEEDAELIAKMLGKKICHMVMSRFLERSENDIDDICSTPDVTMLVAIFEHLSALKIISEQGGTSALCYVAGEGHIPALRVLLRNVEPSSILHADGHLQVLKILAGDISATMETRVAAMELLAKLSQDKQGPSLISEADEDCVKVINYALHCIGALEEEEIPVTNGEDNEGTPETKSTVDSPPLPTWKKYQKNDLDDEIPLQYACLTFLLNLVPIPKCLDQLSTQQKLVPTLHKFSKTESLRLPALKFLQTLAPLSTSHSTLDTDILGGVFIESLRDESSTNIDSKQVAIKGLAVTINDFDSKELQEEAMTTVSSIIQSNVKKCAVQRSSSASDLEQRTLLAKFTYSLIGIVGQVAGATYLRQILESKDLLVSLVHLVEWRYDPRTIEHENQQKKSSDDTEQYLYWNGAVSKALSYLADIFHRLSPDVVSKLLSTVLTIARPGKAPRKTTNFVMSLQQVVQPQPPKDSSAVLAAQQILTNLKGQQS